MVHLLTISKIIEKLWLKKYIISVTSIVSIFDINVEKKNTSQSVISNFNNVKISEKTIKLVTAISFNKSTSKNNIDWNNIIKKIVQENQRSFHNINSYLFIGLLNIKNIVFHSTSLKSNWEPTNNTQTSQNISIIASQKSTIILLSSHIVNVQREIENIIKIKAKNKIRYKNLFLTISLKVLSAIFNIV